MKRLLYLLAALPLLFGGCNKDDNAPETGGTAVQFTTEITRASGTVWDTGDQIGIFMKTAGDDIATSVALSAANVLYTTDGMAFTTTTPIYYPQSGMVDFVAYYPWRATPPSNPYIYKVDVSTQTDPATIDLLWSNNATDKSTASVALQFSHRLSKVVVKAVKGEDMKDEDFTDMGITIAGMPSQVDFSLADGTFGTPAAFADITPRPLTAGEQYEAIIIPHTGTAGRTMVFTVGDDSYIYNIPDTDNFASGKRYLYTITVSKTDISVSHDIDYIPGGGIGW